MTTYILTYDLVKEDSSADYVPLIDDLRASGAHRYQKSSWLIAFNGTASALYAHYRTFLDDDDKLFVAELTRNHRQGKNYIGTNDWIKANPPSR